MATSSAKQAWATGGLVFAGVMMIMMGIWEVLVGIAAIANDGIFLVGVDYTYNIDTTAWGWVHLILGVLVAITGFFLFSGAGWARGIGIVFAALAVINNFLFLPVYPLWSLVLIALGVFVIWALATVDTKRMTAADPYAYQSTGTAAPSGDQSTTMSGDRWRTNEKAPGSRHAAAETPEAAAPQEYQQRQ